jgi:hypothetical protein
MSSHSALSTPPAATEPGSPQPPPAPRSQPKGTPPSRPGADLTKDLGAIALFLLALGSTFWVTKYSSLSLLDEWPMAVLAGLVAFGVLVSGVLRRMMDRPAPAVHLIRLVPACLLIAAALLYLLAITLGLRAWTSPGFGNGYLVVLALGIVAALPRSGDPLTRKPSLWTWFGVSLVGCLAIAHLLLPAYADAWGITGPMASRILVSLVLLAVVPVVSLWAPLQGLRPGLRIMGLTVLVVKVLDAFEDDSVWFASESLGVFGLDEALLLAGLLALGTRSEQQTGRRFARTAAVLTLAVALVVVLSQLVFSQGGWAWVSLPAFWPIPVGGLAVAVFLALQGSRRRAHVFPALGAALVLFTLPVPQFLSFEFIPERLPVVVAVVVLLLIAVVRLDRDPSFDILPPTLKNRHASDPVQLDAMEARAYQQSALVLAIVSVITGPIGILLGIFAFHRAREAEAAGLLTTAPRMIAGLGIIVGILSLFVVPAWLAALGSAW